MSRYIVIPILIQSASLFYSC